MIVGHGPSVLSGLGAVIDSYETVVRLKAAPIEPAEHFGTRTDIISARSHLYARHDVPFWYWHAVEDKWLPVYRKFGQAKPSTGLCAIFCALEYLKPREIALIGFDQLLHGRTGKYNDKGRPGFTAHEGIPEMRCLQSLPVKIIDIVGEHEQVSRMGPAARDAYLDGLPSRGPNPADPLPAGR